MDTSKGQERVDEPAHHKLAAPLSTLKSPMFAIRQELTKELKQTDIDTAQHVANFIVSGEPESVKGVAKAVYLDLKDGNKDAKIELRETKVPYIRVEAPSEEDALSLIRTAQRLSAAYLSGLSVEAKAVFVEPPPTTFTSNFQISVDAMNTTEYGRPTVERLAGPPHVALEPYSEKYKDELSGNLWETFEKASSLHASLIIKVHLGHYFLQTYRKGKFTFDGFESMVKSRRATGLFNTRLGGESFQEELSLEAAMRLIQAADSPCLPMDNQTSTPGHVRPTYILESWHDNDRYEAELDVSRNKHGPTSDTMKFILARTTIAPQDTRLPKKVDWSIVATAGDEKVRTPLAVKKYLEMGEAVLRGSRDDFRCYPVVRLPQSHTLADKFKSVAIKSIYRFSWKRTGYVVQFTINRRWKSIREMNRNGPADTDFDVAIYADNWDQDSRVQPGETVAKIWGEDLRGLLRDEDGDTTGCALSRVKGLVKTILDIRDFFESANLE
ncbi:hypothetical protein F5Y10DRAFT_259829 [Nemania abortiva]|nr:hypothetical protein F5Y10DRAFT_259829 [Nemania abortiva]